VARALSAKPWIVAPGGLAVTIRLTPKGGRDAVEDVETLADGRSVLKARVRAAPNAGEANAALIRLLAKAFDVAPSRVTLAAGTTGRIKRLTIEGDGAAFAAVLETLVSRKD